MAKKSEGQSIPNQLTDQWMGFNSGVQNSADLPKGVSPDELNWVVGVAKNEEGKAIGDHIELRRGTALLGQTRNNANTPVSGLEVSLGVDGTQVPFYAFGTSVWYYNAATEDVANTGLVLPTSAENDDICMKGYTNIAGSYCYVSSPNMGCVYKIPTANPTANVKLTTGQSGYFIFDQSRSFMWNVTFPASGLKNRNNVYISYTDANTYTQDPPFTTQSSLSLGTGDGTTKTFSGTLLASFGAIPAGQTVYGIQIAGARLASISVSAITTATQAVITTSSPHGFAANDQIIIYGVVGMTNINDMILQVVSIQSTTQFTVNIDSSSFVAYSSGGSVAEAEIFTDNLDGTLSSTLGGTGTINYATAAYSVTFNTAPISGTPIVDTFLTEDSVNTGVFDYTVPASRTNGQGLIELQAAGGGPIQAVVPLAGTDYCLHEFDIWQLYLSADDTKASNVIYRKHVGLSNWRACAPTATGILILDNFTSAIPRIRELSLQYTITSLNPLVVPVSISDQLDLTPYTFDKTVIVFWGHYYLVFMKGQTNGKPDPTNDVCFLYNTMSATWDKLDYAATVAAIYYGTLIVGDTLSPNLFTLFSGYDDDGQIINNYYTSAPDGFGIRGQKRFNKFRIKGLIGVSQSFDVYFSYDGAPFVKTATISGSGSYVNKGNPTSVGGYTIGSNIYGGSPTQYANPFEVEFSVGSPRFEYVQYKFVATNIGYVGIYETEYKDCRYKGTRAISTADVSPIP
jgi:hypothetical protein